MRFQLHTIAVAVVALLSVACTNDSYDSGDGNFSYLTAEMVLLHTGSDMKAVSATTDNGENLTLANPFQQEWMTRPDTVYRALLYYDRTGEPEVKVRSVARVPVLHAVEASRVADLSDSPVGLESIWQTAGCDYVNLSLLLKSGKADGDNMQTIVLADDGVAVDATGKRHARLRVVHDQGSVPEYYTVRQFVSLSLADYAHADSVDISVNTQKAIVGRTFAVNRKQYVCQQ